MGTGSFVHLKAHLTTSRFVEAIRPRYRRRYCRIVR